MSQIEGKATYRGAGTADLAVGTLHIPEDRYLSGALWTQAGWYYWFSATAPNGHRLSGQFTGPYVSEDAALDAAIQAGAKLF